MSAVSNAQSGAHSSVGQVNRLPGFALPLIAVVSLAVGAGLKFGLGSGWVGSVILAAIVFVIVSFAATWLVEGGRRARNRLATILVYTAFVLAVIPLGSLIITLLQKGTSRLDAEFFWHSMNNITALDSGGGAYHAIIGTLEQVAISGILAIPLGMAAAIYVVEYGRGRLVKVIRFFVDVMTGIPSIVAGLFILAFWVLIISPLYSGGQPQYSGFAASLALTVLMLPTIVRSSEEMIRMVPGALREGSYALGIPKWKTIMKVVLPTALPGIVTGIMLAIARAAGETAPVLLVAGGTPAINFNPFSGNQESLSYFIYDQAGQSSQYAPARAWTAALTLIALVAILTIAAKLLSRRSTISR